MRRLAQCVGTAMALIGLINAANADNVSVIKKKPWLARSLSGYTITYEHDGKTHNGAKVYCKAGFHPIYMIEGLDRGDGVKVDIDVGSEDGSGVAEFIAPGYMAWARDIWLKTCG